MNCPNCNQPLTLGTTFCECGWLKTDTNGKKIFRVCQFEDKDCYGNVSVRINDSWICTWHYEHGFDAIIRRGVKITDAEKEVMKKFSQVHDYIEAYRLTKPNATNNEACLDYLRRRGLVKLLPPALRDDEARAEREAIENE